MNEDIILKYLRNECNETELRSLNSWLSESDDNKRELFRLEALYKSGKLRQYADKEFIQQQKQEFYRRLENQTNMKKKSLIFRRYMRYAAMIAIVLSLSVWIYYSKSSSQMQFFVASEDNVEHVVLPDGTKVWLNKSATLKAPTTFKGNTRNVFLEGEAYFEVAKNTAQPFIVETDAMEVTVLGTIFNLYSPKNSNRSFVTLLEGEVKVKGNDNEGLVFLSPGQRAELDKSSQRLYIKEVSNASIDAVWHNGLIPFKNATIVEIGETLEQIYGVKVWVDRNIDRTTYSGTIKSKDSISQVLRLLKNSISIDYEIKDDKVYIKNN